MTADFSQIHDALQGWIDRGFIPCAQSTLVYDSEVIDAWHGGFMDLETQTPLPSDAIFRIYSNTKIIASVAAMTLLEDGRYELDDPIGEYLPELNNPRVLKPDAQSIDDTEPAASAPTVRQVMSHSGGYTYGWNPNHPVDAALQKLAPISQLNTTLAEMVTQIAPLPLCYQPGTRFQYSISTDLLGRLVEVWSGQTFDAFLRERIFEPLGMADTGFDVPPEKHQRFTTNYAPAELNNPKEPGLTRVDDPREGNWSKPRRFFSGGAGLVSTMADYTAFIRMLAGRGRLGPTRILDDASVELMSTNQLQPGVQVELPVWRMSDTVFGLGLAIKQAPASGEPEIAAGELHWGGAAGTHSWINPRAGIAGLVFTQRLPGFWDPFAHEFKRLAYRALTE